MQIEGSAANNSSVIKDGSLRDITTRINAILFCGNYTCTGTIRNFSKKGMVIDTSCSFPDDTLLDIVMREIGMTIKVPVRVRRSITKDEFNIQDDECCTGVELLALDPKYMRLLHHIRTTSLH